MMKNWDVDQEVYFIWVKWNGKVSGQVVEKDFMPKEGVLFKHRLNFSEDPELLSELMEKFIGELAAPVEDGAYPDYRDGDLVVQR